MTVDEQIREALAGEPLGPRPTAADRASVERVAVAVRRRRTAGRVAAGALVAALLMVLVVVVWPRPLPEVRTGGEGPSEVIGDDGVPDGWTTMVEPTLGWTIAVPVGWTATSYDGQCRIEQSGTILSSHGEAPPFSAQTDGCTTARDWSGVPTDAVLIELSSRDGGPPPDPTSTSVAPVPIPLTLPPDEQFQPPSTTPGPAFSTEGVVVFDGARRVWVTAWFGADATDAAKADARRVVALLRPPHGGSPSASSTTSSTLDPSWRTVALPTVEPYPTDAAVPSALLQGRLRREGNCLLVDGPGSRSHVVVWSGTDAHMVIDADDQLVAVVVDGRSLPLDEEVVGGGAYGPVGASVRPIHDLSDECGSGELFLSN